MIDYSRVMATHLHPLLGLADRLQMPSHRCRIDQVIRQQLDPPHDYLWRLWSLVQSGWAPHLGSPGSERPPPEQVLAAWRLPLLQSSRRLLRRPPPSARGILRQPPESLVSSSPWAPPTGSRSLRPQHLSTKDKCISQHATTTTLEGSSTSAEYSPSTMLAMGSVASVTGASGSA
jgi:hypothetical protein